MNLENNTNRVAIIGCKNFSAENLYSLLMNGAVGELVLVEEDCEELLEEISALQNSIPLDNAPRVFQGGFEDAASAQMVVIASAARRNPGESPMNLLGRNVKTVREIARKLNQNDFDSVILVVANPADILAQVALEESGLPANKVIGSGKVWDVQSEGKTDRLENEFEQTESATWCAARTEAATVIDFCQPNCPEFGKMIEADVRKPTVITHRKEPPVLVGGSCVSRICEAVLRDERIILPVLTMTKGEYGIKDVYMNLPCIIRRDGVEDVVQLKIGAEEKKEMSNSSEILKRTYKALKENKNLSFVKTI